MRTTFGLSACAAEAARMVNAAASETKIRCVISCRPFFTGPESAPRLDTGSGLSITRHDVSDGSLHRGEDAIHLGHAAEVLEELLALGAQGGHLRDDVLAGAGAGIDDVEHVGLVGAGQEPD